MQNVMRLLHSPNQQKVRYFMLHWNLAAIMERRLHVRKQFLNKDSKVVIGSRDPNPKVAGKGAQILRESGITVIEEIL